MSDLSQYELEDTAILTVQNAKGDDDLIGSDGINPVTIELYGPGSKEMVRALHKAGQAAQLRFQALMRGKVDKKAAEVAEQEKAEKLAAVTKKINNFFDIPPIEVYANPKLCYITKQVVELLDETANFSKGSTKT